VEQVLHTREREFGPDHPDTLVALNNLGGTLLALGHPAEATDLCERSLIGLDRVLGPDHPMTQTARENLLWARRAIAVSRSSES
jgi:Tetratricopeptide repeat